MTSDINYLDIDICHISGIFTVPVSGAWRISYSIQSNVGRGEGNYSWLSLNGNQLQESQYVTFIESDGLARSTGGRVLTLEASAGDTIEMKTGAIDHDYRYIILCVNYISKM